MRRIRQAKYLQLGKKFKSVQNWQPQNAHKHRQQSFLHKNCVSSGRFRKFCPISEEGSLCFNFVFCVYPLPPNTNMVHIVHQCFWSIIEFITIIQVCNMFSLRMINSSKISALGFFIVNRQEFCICQFNKTWSCQFYGGAYKSLLESQEPPHLICDYVIYVRPLWKRSIKLDRANSSVMISFYQEPCYLILGDNFHLLGHTDSVYRRIKIVYLQIHVLSHHFPRRGRLCYLYVLRSNELCGSFGLQTNSISSQDSYQHGWTF